MKIILSVIVVMLMIGAQSVYAESEYDLGYKRGLNDANTYRSNVIGPPDLRATVVEINKHPSAFYQGWLDGFCSITHMVMGSQEISFSCSLDTSQTHAKFAAMPGYWTTNSSDTRQDYAQYHVYLYGSFPSLGLSSP